MNAQQITTQYSCVCVFMLCAKYTCVCGAYEAKKAECEWEGGEKGLRAARKKMKNNYYQIKFLHFMKPELTKWGIYTQFIHDYLFYLYVCCSFRFLLNVFVCASTSENVQNRLLGSPISWPRTKRMIAWQLATLSRVVGPLVSSCSIDRCAHAHTHTHKHIIE